MVKDGHVCSNETKIKKYWFPPIWIQIVLISLYTVSIVGIVIMFKVDIYSFSVDVSSVLAITRLLNKPTVKVLPSNCVEAAGNTRQSGVYDILVPFYYSTPFKVACSEEYDNGGWTVVLRRVDGSVDFYRDWYDYKHGFGNLYNEFWIGLDKLHALTSEKSQELLIILQNENNVTGSARYEHFAIANETLDYALIELSGFTGDIPDALEYHVGQKFTTKDRKNNLAPNNCAVQHGGAWWFKYCRKSNLNGRHLFNDREKSIAWHNFSENITNPVKVKFAEMLIRPTLKLN